MRTILSIILILIGLSLGFIVSSFRSTSKDILIEFQRKEFENAAKTLIAKNDSMRLEQEHLQHFIIWYAQIDPELLPHYYVYLSK
jgi:hypothetical protein